MSDELGVDPFDGETLDLIVPGTLDAIRVDRVLSMLTGLSRSETSAMLASGAVRIDDKVVVKASMNVETGQHLVAVLPLADSGDVEPDPTVEVDIVVDDEDFCVVNKAPGQVVHPGAGQRTGTLVAGLLARYPQMADLVATGLCEPLRPGIVHRLDKGTSGVMVVAKTPEGFISLSTQLSERLIERTYLGMVEGHVAEERGVVDAPIGRSMRTPTMMAVRADGRPARTGYEVLARIDKPNAMTLLRLGLDTGRTHQIRVHMAKIGHPIVNDARYGHRRERRLDEDRFFLHSTTLSFTHPRTDELVVTHVALPDDLRVLVPEGLEL
jgi:23S rRNA pseudouridine1911/1915/1917 synthase